MLPRQKFRPDLSQLAPNSGERADLCLPWLHFTAWVCGWVRAGHWWGDVSGVWTIAYVGSKKINVGVTRDRMEL